MIHLVDPDGFIWHIPISTSPTLWLILPTGHYWVSSTGNSQIHYLLRRSNNTLASLPTENNFVTQRHMLFDDASAELDVWREFYNVQFEDEETRMFNSGILDMFNFEYRLRHPNDRPIPRILDTVESVVGERALVEPLADVPWTNFIPIQSVATDKNEIDGKSIEGFRGLHIPRPTIQEQEMTGCKGTVRGDEETGS